MSAAQTLRSSRDFHRVRTTGARARSDGITAWVAPGQPGQPARLGLAVRSKRAVDRNRIRRRLRAAWRELVPEEGSDAVVMAGADTLSLDFHKLTEHVGRALNRAKERG